MAEAVMPTTFRPHQVRSGLARRTTRSTSRSVHLAAASTDVRAIPQATSRLLRVMTPRFCDRIMTRNTSTSLRNLAFFSRSRMSAFSKSPSHLIDFIYNNVERFTGFTVQIVERSIDLWSKRADCVCDLGIGPRIPRVLQVRGHGVALLWLWCW